MKMDKKGYVQGEMAPTVKDYQKPTKSFPESGFSRTLDYIERRDSFEGKESKGISKQDYKGRYS